MASKKFPLPPPARGAEAVLRAYALSFDGAVEEFPWGHRVMKVRGKMFVIFGGNESSLNIAVKLPKSNAAALALPNCEPTPYGMGKHGWVTSKWPPFQEPDVELLKPWIAESYAAIEAAAPKKKAKPKRAPTRKTAISSKRAKKPQRKKKSTNTRR